ncbi:hypothetical protein [Aeromicrobium stalagmiti]|uniref:hypothetical protein n=1 Tax=Aeromicrobium stalagmiti TaxID=2738988 RepID=UPI001568F858|nr:hypothetical protein [Aeromicrobium stalagmiti]NRQ49034.1 hypothetical protein [Aeromicrobium stalagmiti]
MSTNEDDDLLDEIRGLAEEVGLTPRAYEHDEVAAEEMLEQVLAQPRARASRPRRWRPVAASVAVAASVVGLFALNGAISGTGDTASSEAASGAAVGSSDSASGGAASPAPERAEGYKANLDGSLGATLDEDSSRFNRMSAAPTIVVADDVRVGSRTRATVVETLRGDVAAGTRIEVRDSDLALSIGLSGSRRHLYILAGPGPYEVYGSYVETTPGVFTSARVGDAGPGRRIVLDELRASLE